MNTNDDDDASMFVSIQWVSLRKLLKQNEKQVACITRPIETEQNEHMHWNLRLNQDPVPDLRRIGVNAAGVTRVRTPHYLTCRGPSMRWTPAVTATESWGKGEEGKNERGGPLNILSALMPMSTRHELVYSFVKIDGYNTAWHMSDRTL